MDHNIRNKKKIHESEVAATAVQKVHIDKIKEEIAECEKTLENEFNHENVQALTEQYQKAIEYYAALGDEQFAIYLNKMKELIRKEDELLTTKPK